jgi:hypothetical protein
LEHIVCLTREAHGRGERRGEILVRLWTDAAKVVVAKVVVEDVHARDRAAGNKMTASSIVSRPDSTDKEVEDQGSPSATTCHGEGAAYLQLKRATRPTRRVPRKFSLAIDAFR